MEFTASQIAGFINGKIIGDFVCTGVRPNFLSRAAYYGLDKDLMEAMNT